MSDTKKIIRQLNIIKGQVEGITKMIQEERGCKEVMVQIKAVKSGFNNIAERFIKEHLKDCLSNQNNQKMIPMEEFDEILSLFAKM